MRQSEVKPGIVAMLSLGRRGAVRVTVEKPGVGGEWMTVDASGTFRVVPARRLSPVPPTTEAPKPGYMTRQARRANRFHFGFCNACERYACGESAEQLIASPTKDAVCGADFELSAVMAGVHAAVSALAGDIDGAMRSASEFGLSQGSQESLRDLVLSA